MSKDAVTDKVDEIKRLAKEKFKARIGAFKSVCDDIAKALESDRQLSKRLPTEDECSKMMGSDADDDEEDLVRDPELQRLFPQTYEQLESLWQLGPPHRW